MYQTGFSAVLHVLRGEHAGTSLRLGPITSVGRSRECDLQLRHHKVSRLHCVIELSDGQYLLQDRGSTNGTFINGERVDSEILKDGDLIEIGVQELRFKIDQSIAQPRVEYREPAEGAEEVVLAANVDDSFSTGSAAPGPGNEENAHAAKQFEAVLRATEAIAEIRDPTTLLTTILEHVFSVLPGQRGVVLLGATAAEAKAVAVRSDTGKNDKLYLSRTIMERVFRDREALFVVNSASDELLSGAESVMLSGMRSIICAPLATKERVHGAIQIEATRVGAFKPQDLRILVAIARQAAISLENARLLKEIKTETRIRSQIERYLPRELVDVVVRDELDMGMGGTSRKIVVMFTDLRGFTEMSERLEPSAIVETMNEYFGYMVDEVFHFRGTLDKFIGDAIMALWGAPIARPDDTVRAVQCALEMQNVLAELNAIRLARGEQPLAMGIGLHTGIAVVGNIGSERRIEYTALGSAVNLAARIEGRTRSGEIIMSEDMHRELKDEVIGEWLDDVSLKGISKPVRLFRLNALVEAPSQESSESNLAPSQAESRDTAPGTARLTPRRPPPSLRGRMRPKSDMTIRVLFADPDVSGPSAPESAGFVKAVLQDVSLHGAGFLIGIKDQPVPEIGSSLEIVMDIDHKSLIVPATVRGLAQVGRQADSVYRFGVQWNELTLDRYSAIETLVRRIADGTR